MAYRIEWSLGFSSGVSSESYADCAAAEHAANELRRAARAEGHTIDASVFFENAHDGDCDGDRALCDLCVRELRVHERSVADDDGDLFVACTACGCRSFFSEESTAPPVDCHACGADLAAQTSHDDDPAALTMKQLRARYQRRA